MPMENQIKINQMTLNYLMKMSNPIPVIQRAANFSDFACP